MGKFSFSGSTNHRHRRHKGSLLRIWGEILNCPKLSYFLVIYLFASALCKLPWRQKSSKISSRWFLTCFVTQIASILAFSLFFSRAIVDISLCVRAPLISTRWGWKVGSGVVEEGDLFQPFFRPNAGHSFLAVFTIQLHFIYISRNAAFYLTFC